jgi:hypothetical protein
MLMPIRAYTGDSHMGKIALTPHSSLKLNFVVSFAVLVLLTQQTSMAESISQQKKAVVFIFGTIHPVNPDMSPIRGSDGNPIAIEVPLGTGFFIKYTDENSGQSYSYLVTARHVLQDMNGGLLPAINLRINLNSTTSQLQYGFINNVPVSDAHGNLLWLHSDDPTADVAMLPLLPDDNVFEYAGIASEDFLSDAALQVGSIAEGDELYFIGMMAQYYGAKRNYPLVRHGTLAMLTDEKINTPTGPQRVFIAELESWPGNSGSPVFLETGLRTKNPALSLQEVPGQAYGSLDDNDSVLLGVVVASFLNKVTVPLGGAQPGRQLQAGDTANTGVTCIVPASVLVEILDSKEARERRSAIGPEGQSLFR